MKPKQIELSPEQATYHAVFQPVTTPSQEHIASLLMDRPDAYLPDNAILDQIVDGTVTFNELRAVDGLEHFNWVEDYLEAIDWWRKLAAIVLQSRTPGEFGPSQEFSDQRKTLSRLLRKTLRAYGDAIGETSPYNESWRDLGPATFELLRRYRVYTRCVESFVLEVFPDLNRELLLRPDFGFVHESA